MSDVAGLPRTATPLVSVVICTHRRPGLLPRAIRSVLEQTLTDLELIVVDDASGDETTSVVESFAETDARVRPVVNAQNLGLPASRNVGVSKARGTYVGFLDDDDEWHPTKLERQVAVLDAAPESVGAAWCLSRWRYPDGRERVRTIRLQGNEHRRLRRVDLALMQPLLVRRSVFETVGPFSAGFRIFEDYDWTLRLARHFQFVTVDAVLVTMHATPGSMSTDAEDEIVMIGLVLDRHGSTLGRAGRARWRIRLARAHAGLGRGDAWRRAMREALRETPWSPRCLALYAVGTIAGPDAHLRAARARNRFGRWRRSLSSR